MSSLTLSYWHESAADDAAPAQLRTRNISATVLTATLTIPAPPARLFADWEREMAQQLNLQAGDVESLPLARARMRWPEYTACVQAVGDWTRQIGMPDVLADSEVALMACRGARYHHDGERYGGSAFCNLFLSDDKGLDLHFPASKLRIPLVRGMAVIFDTAQPHAVIPRDGKGFSVSDFPPERDCSQVFLTWELPLDDASVAQILNISFDQSHSST